ncbi:MAG: hypothetical protein ACI8RN_002056 [Glaciecola sp.]
MTIEYNVEECEPAERLAWSSESFGVSIYHAWRMSPQPQGCYVLREETQNGVIPRIGAILAPKRMHKFHQIWLKQLKHLNKVAKGAA